jgi:hypothetical protein
VPRTPKSLIEESDLWNRINPLGALQSYFVNIPRRFSVNELNEFPPEESCALSESSNVTVELFVEVRLIHRV